MSTIHHQVSIHAAASRVYQAVSTAEGISTWWDKQTPIHSDRGLVLEHNPGPQHGAVQLRVVESIPNQRVEFECVSHHPPSSPASAWTATRFTFALSPSGDVTTLDFRQTGYDEQREFFATNNQAWRDLLQHLKQVVESQST
jgi:uncharacterized protein YndB with AHSA1/START domain